MLGFFQENGPWIVDDDNNTIYENPYSWNKRANVLYMESPAGVGFSIANTDEAKKHNDFTQSQDTFAALNTFFGEFPERKSNPLYISGESYGGIYVPYQMRLQLLGGPILAARSLWNLLQHHIEHDGHSQSL